MSVATEFAPGFDGQFDDDDFFAAPAPRRAGLRAVPAIEPVARPGSGRPQRLASVSVLTAPADVSPGLRLTRRGVAVLGLAAAGVGLILVWLAALSAPAQSAAPARGPAVVTVSPGDTLWSIAGRVAPASDPRGEVEHLRHLNNLGGVDLVPGQQLRVR